MKTYSDQETQCSSRLKSEDVETKLFQIFKSVLVIPDSTLCLGVLKTTVLTITHLIFSLPL